MVSLTGQRVGVQGRRALVWGFGGNAPETDGVRDVWVPAHGSGPVFCLQVVAYVPQAQACIFFFDAWAGPGWPLFSLLLFLFSCFVCFFTWAGPSFPSPNQLSSLVEHATHVPWAVPFSSSSALNQPPEHQNPSITFTAQQQTLQELTLCRHFLTKDIDFAHLSSSERAEWVKQPFLTLSLFHSSTFFLCVL